MLQDIPERQCFNNFSSTAIRGICFPKTFESHVITTSPPVKIMTATDALLDKLYLSFTGGVVRLGTV